jgi:SAM-dependent methyltransferase
MAEFDRLSEGYSAGFDDPLKKVLGDSPKAFLTPKIKRLLRFIRRAEPGLTSGNLLDFGCGNGEFLGQLSRELPGWRLEGCDVSAGMLAEAKKRLGLEAEKIKFWQTGDNHSPTQVYDVVTVVCVLHHIEPKRRAAVLANIAAGLRPGGILAIFEHNPWNPATRWMVSRTEVDRNAILLAAPVLKRLVHEQPFRLVTLENFLFFPPRLSSMSVLEPLLRWLPMGGHYALFARRL